MKAAPEAESEKGKITVPDHTTLNGKASRDSAWILGCGPCEVKPRYFKNGALHFERMLL